MSSTASVIIVEDEGVVALDLKRRLERMGYSVAAQASGGREAVEKVRETAPDLVLMDISLGEDLDGIEAAEKLTGWREEEAKGRPLGAVLRLLDGATREPQQNAVGRIVSEGRPHPLPENTLLLPRGGEPVPIEDSFAPIQDPKRGVLGAVLVFHDVTQRREAEQHVQQLNEELERHVADLEDFCYSVAHHLRAPL